MIDIAFYKRSVDKLKVPVYPDVVPQAGEYPCVVYTLVSRPSLQLLSQRIKAETARIQVNVYAFDAERVESLAESCLTTWRTAKGAIDGLVGERINSCWMDEDSYDAGILLDVARPLHYVQFDLMVEILGD